ncbi:hypothetical protein BDW22DRAFT_1358150 [Trametopsis cervina]|nr:hypothetical protein BDW22DRAFT_1358150 [Trametopsis cervina]
MSSSVRFPSPIGGVPSEADFAPSIIFALAYAIISFGSLYRLARPRSRTIVTIGTLAHCIEHVVLYSLRAKQARNPSEAFNHGLTKYWQITYAIDFLAIVGDVNNCMRCLLVKTTMASPENLQLSSRENAQGLAISPDGGDVPLTVDDPKKRDWYRQIFGINGFFVFPPLVLGIIAGADYVPAETDPSKANTVYTFRYAVAGMAFVLITFSQIISLYGYTRVPTIRKGSCIIAFVVASLLNVGTIYRLVVLRLHTTSLTSTAPGSLNSSSSKATFYVFQVSADLLAAAILANINVRERFSTGPWGDIVATMKSRERK